MDSKFDSPQDVTSSVGVMPAGQNRWKQVYGQVVNVFYISVWKKAWPLWIGAVALAFANILMFVYARAIGVFPQMAMWGSYIYNLFGIKVDAPFIAYPLTPLHLDMHSLLNFGIIFGVAIAALISQEFKIRTEDWRGYTAALAGGILMGFGTVIMPPCNVGGFYSATMALSLSGPLSVLGLLPGAYVGGLFLKHQAKKSADTVDFGAAPAGKPAEEAKTSFQPLIGAAIGMLLVAIALIYVSQGMSKFAGLLLFGALFGVIFQRSRLCFASAFREIFVSRNGEVMKWILLSIAIGTIGFTILKSQGYQQTAVVLPVGLHTVIGGFIFGIGMSIAGGCGVGILWRSAEGYVRAWIALIAGILTAGSWVLVYGKHVGEGWLYGKPVFLPNVFGWFGAVSLVFLFLAVFYALITWVEVGKNEKN
ncbi:MAG: YeeE/YedE family protein [Desulfobacterales bacterium]|nr:YeeE/YedE family protein [Desulfobacterales bacterium]